MIEWHDIHYPDTGIRLRVGPDVLAHFGSEKIKELAPAIQQAVDALPFDPGETKKTLHGPLGGIEIICYAHSLQENGVAVKVYYFDSMERFQRYNPVADSDKDLEAMWRSAFS